MTQSYGVVLFGTPYTLHKRHDLVIKFVTLPGEASKDLTVQFKKIDTLLSAMISVKIGYCVGAG